MSMFILVGTKGIKEDLEIGHKEGRPNVLSSIEPCSLL